MHVLLSNTHATLEEYTSVEHRWLSQYLSCREMRFSGRGNDVTATPVYHTLLGTGAHPAFPAGLARLVHSAAKKEGIDIVWYDSRKCPGAPDDAADLSGLRDYQLSAVRAAATKERGIIQGPTGSGKTHIFLGLTQFLPVEWLFVVHRSDIVEQTIARYERHTGERAGTYSGGTWDRGTANVTVATFQALHRALRNGHQIDFFDAVNVDEVHAQPAASFFETTLSLSRAYYRIGQSATPLHRGDLESLRAMGALGPVVYKIETQLLIDRGVLSKPAIKMFVLEQGVGVECSWAAAYKKFIVQSARRNALVLDMAQRARKPCLLFVERVAHGHDIQKRLEKAGVSCDFAWGARPVPVRQSLVKRLEEGYIDVLICNRVFQEGIDIPALKSVVVAAGRQSTVEALQRLGRGMRTCADGDDSFELWDVFDTGHKWLRKHALERQSAYESEGHEVEISY